jgi:hypothetical protein
MRWLFALALVAACSDSSGPARPVDAAIDAAADPCVACGTDQICVARYDGTCRGQAACVTRTIDCPDNACTAGCEAAYCMPSYQCRNRPPCGGEPPGAFTCYGP